MRALLILTVMAATLSAGVTEDLQAAASSKEAAKAAKGVSSVTAEKKLTMAKSVGSLAATAAAESFAEIRSSAYGFEWLLLSGGWYWDSDSTYVSFDEITQDFNDLDTFAATFSLLIFADALDPQTLANQDITDNSGKTNYSAVEEATETTFAGETAYYNSYAYTSAAVDWSYDKWFLVNDNVTYMFEVFTTLEDYNANATLYMLMADVALTFSQASIGKSVADATRAPAISYYPARDGSVRFDLAGLQSDLYIYGVDGSLVRTLRGTSIWDGKDMAGRSVSTGYYVTNIKSDLGTFPLKVLKK